MGKANSTTRKSRRGTEWSMNEYDFRFYFNKKKQFCEVSLWEVHPNTFARWGAGRWGYFLATYDQPRAGKFGELHFVEKRLRYDTITHELFHLAIEWVWSGGDVITRKNEEKYASFFDEITRNFVRELRKIRPGIRL